MYYFVYILTNKPQGTLYIGITNNLIRRIYEHKQKTTPSFSKKYALDLLVHYEIFVTSYEAITREKQLKKWNRAWKIALIEKNNKVWKDLYGEIV